MRKRLEKIAKRSLIILILLGVGIAFGLHVPDWMVGIRQIHFEMSTPAVSHSTTEAAVPEPTTMALIGLGGAALAFKRSRNRGKN